MALGVLVGDGNGGGRRPLQVLKRLEARIRFNGSRIHLLPVGLSLEY